MSSTMKALIITWVIIGFVIVGFAGWYIGNTMATRRQPPGGQMQYPQQGGGTGQYQQGQQQFGPTGTQNPAPTGGTQMQYQQPPGGGQQFPSGGQMPSGGTQIQQQQKY